MSVRNKNKILCLTSNLPRWKGDWTPPFVLHLAHDLQQLGWQVDILAPHAAGCAKREVLEGVSIERFQYFWPENQQSICYQGGALINLRRKPSNYARLPALLLFQLAALLRRLNEGRYDLIHSHWLLPQGFIGALGARRARLPHVITIHGGDVFGLRQAVFRPFKQAALKHADAVTVNSSATARAVQSIASKLPSLHQFPMGIDISGISKADPQVVAIRQQYRPGAGPLIVFAGRIVDEKGLEDLIRAMPQILKHCPQARALVAGEGPQRAAMQTLMQQSGLSEQVFFTGWIDAKQIPAYLAAADVFAGPSRQAPDGRVEAQGLTFLEAMAAGTPVVATRIGGIGDTVIHEHTGLLVDERSPHQIAEAVMRLHTDTHLALKLRRQGRKMVEQSYSRQACAARFSELFHKLIASPIWPL